MTSEMTSPWSDADVAHERVVDVVAQHVRHEHLEDETHERKDDRRHERHAVRLNHGQYSTPPGQVLIARDLVARTGILRADPSQGIGRMLLSLSDAFGTRREERSH